MKGQLIFNTYDLKRPIKRTYIKLFLVGSAFIWAVDIIYKILNDISYVNREQCILYKNLPKTGFLFFEYFFETALIVFVGAFIAVCLARHFTRFKMLFPRNPLTAFVYGSVIPACSCAAIPLLWSMKGKLKFSTIISFILSAPLLSPYIIVLSFSVLGVRYAILRIVTSFVMVMLSSYILGFLVNGSYQPVAALASKKCGSRCGNESKDLYLETFNIFKSIFPFLIIAGAVGLFLELLGPRETLITTGSGKSMLGIITWIFVGAPLYFCHGAEVLFLRSLVSHGFPIGTAIAFSMTSTAVCTTSFAMLSKIMGIRLTIILVGCVIGISLASALLLNGIF